MDLKRTGGSNRSVGHLGETFGPHSNDGVRSVPDAATLQVGIVQTDWRDPLPRIPDFMPNSVVYLYADQLSAEDGVPEGGSGFVVTIFSEVNSRTVEHSYAVTNAHVIDEGYSVVRMNLRHPISQTERTKCFNFSKESWVSHPTHDLAVHAFPPDLERSVVSLTSIGIESFLSEKQCIDDLVGAGDDLVYIGRFVDHAGKYENLPSVRFGNISLMPSENEPVEYELNGTNRKQVGFLVETRSRAGYSGSPVFLLQQRKAPGTRLVFADSDLRLLGVDWGHLLEEVPLRDPRGHLHGQRFTVKVHAGMMGVVPAWYLRDFLETSPRLSEQRKRDDDYYRTHPPPPVSEEI